MIPRFIWVIFVFVAYTIAGVAGREHFSAILSNFLSILSYWTAFFVVIVTEEHFIFRQKGGRLRGYDLGDWDKPSKYVPPHFNYVAIDNDSTLDVFLFKSSSWFSFADFRLVLQACQRHFSE